MENNDELGEKYKRMIMLQFFAYAKQRGFVERVGRPVENPTRGQGRVLALLKLKDGISTKELAQILGMRVSSLNELLQKMEASGYVERRASETDGRVMLAYLTQEGREVKQGDSADSNTFEWDLFKGLSDDERKELGVLFDKIIAKLEENIGTEEVERMRHKQEDREKFLHEKFGNASDAFTRANLLETFGSVPVESMSHHMVNFWGTDDEQ